MRKNKRPIKNSIYNEFNIDPSEDILETSLSSDRRMFLDPLKIDRKLNELSRKMSLVITDFYTTYINEPENVFKYGSETLSIFKEPSENHLGYCKEGYRGKGGGSNLIIQLENKLDDLRKRNVQHFRHMSFACDRVSYDVTSDLTTRIVFKQLAEYTLKKCLRYNIPTSSSNPIYYWDHEKHKWEKESFNLPTLQNGDVMVFIPECICNYTVSMSDFKRFAKMGIVKYMMYHWEEISLPFEKFPIKKANGRRITQKDFIEEMRKNNFNVFDYQQFWSLNEDLRNKIIAFYEQICEE